MQRSSHDLIQFLFFFEFQYNFLLEGTINAEKEKTCWNIRPTIVNPIMNTLEFRCLLSVFTIIAGVDILHFCVCQRLYRMELVEILSDAYSSLITII